MAGPFTPNPQDGAVQLLRQVFGPVIDNILSSSGSVSQTTAAPVGAANMLSASFNYFNTGVLFFTAIIMTYVVIFGIANSANDGEVLGKKWSTWYTPIRTFGASALLIPSASGYSGIQVFLLMVTMWSIGFGSNMWTNALQQAYTNDLAPMVATSVIDDKSFEDLAMNAIRMQVCAYAATKAYQTVTGDTSSQMQLTTSPVTTDNGMGGTTTVTSTIYYSMPNWPGSSALCGSISMTDSYNPQQSLNSANGTAWYESTNAQTTSQTIINLHNAIVKIRYNYTLGLFGAGSSGGPSLAPIVQKIISTAETDGATINAATDIAAPIQALRQQLTTAMINEVTSELSNSNAGVITTLGQNGWIYAGSLYKEISTIKEAVRSATQSTYTYTPGMQNASFKLSGAFLQAYTAVTANYSQIMQLVTQKVLATPSPAANSSSTSMNSTTDKIQTSFTVEDFAGGGDGVMASIKKYFNAIPSRIVGGIVTHLSDTEGDPIWAIKDMGDDMRNVCETIIIARIAIESGLAGLIDGLKVASNESVLGTNVSAAGGVVVGLVSALAKFIALSWNEMRISLYTILYAGYYMSIWIPSIPFFVYTIGVGGWLIFVVEMLVAGSLWMAAHTAPAREDSFIGSQMQGYMLIMSGFFRPALMVFGLIASIVLTRPLVQYVNEAFRIMFMSVTADSYVGISGVAGYIALYCFTVSALLMMIFALPQSLPDRILRWVGAGIGDMGEQGTMQKIEGTSSSQARMAQQAGAAREDARNRQNAEKANQAAQNERDGVQRQIMQALSSMASGGEVVGQGGQSRAAMDGGSGGSSPQASPATTSGSAPAGPATSPARGGSIEGQGGQSHSAGTTPTTPTPPASNPDDPSQ